MSDTAKAPETTGSNAKDGMYDTWTEAAVAGQDRPVSRLFKARLANRPMHERFALVGGLVSVIGMIIIGAFVSSRIEAGVVRNSAVSTAVYMETFIAPLSQELAAQNELSAESRARLRNMLNQPGVKDLIVSVKLWKKGGYIAYAGDPDMIGKTFEPTEHLKEAWQGDLIASFDELDNAESAAERSIGVPLLEVYNPIHSIVTGNVIAVAEFYQDASKLQHDLNAARLTSWAVVAGVAGTTFLALFGIVLAGSRTIQHQHGELRQRIDEITRVSNQNASLRQRILSASERAAALNEEVLRRIGVELHDGPAQALALANLRIGKLRGAADNGEAEMIHTALEQALTDIRGLARGLVLPELEGKSVESVIRRAADAHVERSGTQVSLEGAATTVPPRQGSLPILICVYRFVQEGLMNAWRHANGKGQKVSWKVDSGDLTVSVCDTGPGFDPEVASGKGRIGLDGLRERVQSVGGQFRIDSQPGGTRLSMRLPLEGRG